MKPWQSIKEFFGYRAKMHDAGQAIPENTTPEQKAERRNYTYKSLEAQRLLLGITAGNGPNVNSETVLGYPPMFGACRYISEGIAMLDRKVLRDVAAGGTEIAIGHPIQKLMQAAPHPYYGWFDMVQSWVANAFLGNGYLKIHWDEKTMRPQHLEVIPLGMCWPEIVSGQIMYRISGEINGKQVSELLPHTDIIHLKGFSTNGLNGKQIALVHQTTFSNALSAQEYSKSIFANSARPSIAVKYNEPLDDQERKNLRQNIMDEMSGTANAGVPMILDDGMEIQYLQWSPQEVAFVDFSKMAMEYVVMITKVPTDLLYSSSTGTYASVLARNQNFLSHCLGPWMERIQEAFNQKLFWADEFQKRKVWFQFDTSVFLKTNREAETNMAVSLTANGIITINEARARLGLNARPEGDKLMSNINTIPLEDVTKVAMAKYLSSAGEKLAGENTENKEPENTAPEEI